jgi:hypothetical protein
MNAQNFNKYKIIHSTLNRQPENCKAKAGYCKVISGKKQKV